MSDEQQPVFSQKYIQGHKMSYIAKFDTSYLKKTLKVGGGIFSKWSRDKKSRPTSLIFYSAYF